ncbi:hypothetical protein [Fortiea contorta]|uniref:hypothetical protein n=1 Tax=Fortiea contorta TaxID=1892405 RepID=UPI00034CEC2B|nr:hypothetical protein [Fortiea contorta]
MRWWEVWEVWKEGEDRKRKHKFFFSPHSPSPHPPISPPSRYFGPKPTVPA